MDELPNKININQTISYLNYTFAEALKTASPIIGVKNTQGTPLHTYQVEYCYLIDEVQRGPSYSVPKTISQINDLINEVQNLSENRK